MIKIICDSCQSEITNQLVSEFSIIYRDQKSKLLGKKEEVKKGVMMLCENCALAVKNLILNLQKTHEHHDSKIQQSNA